MAVGNFHSECCCKAKDFTFFQPSKGAQRIKISDFSISKFA